MQMEQAYISYALQYVLDEWQRFVDLALQGPDEKRRKTTEKQAVAAAASGGAESVLRRRF